MKRLLSVALGIAAVAFTASSAVSEVIASYTIKTGIGYSSKAPHDVINIAITGDSELDEIVLFNGKDGGCSRWTNGIDLFDCVGQTFWVSSNQDDPEFESFVNYFTDDNPHNVRIWFANGMGGAGYSIYWSNMPETHWDQELAPFKGYTIDRIGLRIDSAYRAYDPTASLPYAPGLFLPYVSSGQVTCIFDGSPPVPEPTSFVALVMGVGGLFYCRSSRLARKEQKRKR